MKLKIYITSLLFLAIVKTYAQVGIGTTSPDASSMLDITSTNSGLLIPRVSLTSVSDVATIASPLTSLLVYNSGFSPNGYYYWNGSIWVQLAVGLNADWSLTGNTGTSAATNFFGTTDDVDIVFKRFNIRSAFIGNPTGATSTTANVKNTSLGANSLVNPAAGYRNTAIGTNVMPGNTTGSRNVAVGDVALSSNTTGIENVAIGVGALFSNSTNSSNVAVGRNALTANTADFNTAVGDRALNTNSNGTLNTAIGVNSLFQNTLGNNNTSAGVQSLRSNTTGNNNSAFGYQSFFSNISGIGNLGLGYQAGYNETGSNKLYIENSNADANNALIYGEFDNNIVRINGTLQISNPASAPGYSLPIVRGTAGQFLQTDGNGGSSWSSNTVFPYTTTGAATGVYLVALTQYTIRVFGSVSEIRLPTPVGNTGKIFVIIGSNGISSKVFSSTSGNIYDDVTNAFITTISGSVRYTVQSDGTDWIVIAR
ncbi:hypothetical protein [Flavobacterium sp.]|uniref:hypothetical protein n=1 Tax=Flavobacterium sp. TaxID=239 RepID=UPI0025D5D037|nr:hypothetical protein [Flavobacterium sp.]